MLMAFGAGVLISALAFELVDEAFEGGGLLPTAAGFLSGALIFVGSNILLARAGAKHRKRSGGQLPAEEESPGSGTTIAVGALINGVPGLTGRIPASENSPAGTIAFITAVAAGGILAMLADIMIPEAFEEHHNPTGLTAAVGFLTAFIIHHAGG